MKNYIYVIVMLLMLFSVNTLVASCEDINDKHDLYMRQGETLRVGKVDSLSLYSGNMRARLKCWVGDYRAKKLMITIENSDEVIWFNLSEANREDSVVVNIPNLQEGTNQLSFVTTNEGKTILSIPVKATVAAFGERYQTLLSQRTISKAESVGGRVKISWGARLSAQLVGQEVSYRTMAGNDTTYRIPASESLSVLYNARPSGTFSYQSLYIPTVNAIDTFRVEKKIVEYTSIYEGTERPVGMKSIATQLAKKIFLGWNLGNSLEVSDGETAWGNPKTSKSMIDAIKNAGFTAVRIPCKWMSFLKGDANYTIQEDRLARVKEVVDYCISNNLYVILNTHHDWIENGATLPSTTEAQAQVAEDMVNKIWGQIANTFRNYDEHLLFACTNEPDAPKGRGMELLKRYEQAFVNVVRASGGNNIFRVLVVQCPNTNIGKAVDYMDLVNDPTPYSLMVEVHHYAPDSFCLLSDISKCLWGDKFKDTGKIEIGYQESFIDQEMARMSKFVNNDIPVVLGEYGCRIKRDILVGDPLFNLHAESRAYYMKYITQQAKKNGLIPFLWDDGYNFLLFDRNNCVISRPSDMKALLDGAKSGIYPY